MAKELTAHISTKTNETTSTYESREDGIFDSTPVVSQKMISCEKLYKLVVDVSISMLIMDCRSEEDFTQSKLVHRDCVNIPERIVKKGFVYSYVPYTVISNQFLSFKSNKKFF